MADNDSDNEKGDFFNPEEEIGFSGTAKSSIPIVEVKTGEEEDELIFKMRARLYRWRDPEWKERGTGEMKLLRNTSTKKIRCILRQDKTLKPVCNFIVAEDPFCSLKEHQGSDKMFFFTAYDCSDEDFQVEKFVFKFGNAENGAKFKTAFNDAREFNKAVKAGEELKYAPVLVDDEEEEAEKTKKTCTAPTTIATPTTTTTEAKTEPTENSEKQVDE